MELSSASDWMRAPFLIIGMVINWIRRNLIALIIIIIALFIIVKLFKFFRWAGKKKTKYENKKIERDSEIPRLDV